MFGDLIYRLRSLFRRRAAEAELDDELDIHLEHETEKLMRSGLAPEEARRRARMAIGGAAQIKEDVRDEWLWRWCRDAAQDARYAFRALRQSPTFTAVAEMTALGRAGAPDDIGSMIASLVSDENRWVNGQRSEVSMTISPPLRCPSMF